VNARAVAQGTPRIVDGPYREEGVAEVPLGQPSQAVDAKLELPLVRHHGQPPMAPISKGAGFSWAMRSGSRGRRGAIGRMAIST